MSKRTQDSELTTAAEALDAELRRFEEVADRIRTAPLDSQKNLERMANALREIADLDDSLSGRVKALVAAIAGARDRQQRQAEMISQRAQELQGRTNVFQELVQKYADLGTQAATLNAQVQEAFAAQKTGTAEGEAEAASRLTEINEGTGQLAEEARKVTEAANEAGFTDIARQADELRQQLLSARNKINLLSKRLPSA